MTHSNESEATVTNIEGVFSDLDDGGLTDTEALDQIRKLVGARKPLPDKIVLIGKIGFTVTIDTRTKNVEEFEYSLDAPDFEQRAEKRLSGEEVDIESEVLADLINIATLESGNWPDPVQM